MSGQDAAEKATVRVMRIFPFHNICLLEADDTKLSLKPFDIVSNQEIRLGCRLWIV